MTQGRRSTWWSVLALLVLLVHALGAQAQDSSPVPNAAATLVVSLRDDQDAPVAGATIIVRNADSDGAIGRVDTAADGTATILLPVSVQTIRVAVTGQMPSGMPLTHQAADIGGILFFPGALGETRLDLVVTADGVVLPDPSMWALDPVPVLAATMPPFDRPVPVASPPVIEPGMTPTPGILTPTPTPWIAATPAIGAAILAPAESHSRGAGGMLLLIAGLLVVGGVALVVRRGR